MHVNRPDLSTIGPVVLIATMLAATVLAPVATGQDAETIHVCKDGGCDYTSIQDGLDAATPGDKVVVHPADDGDYKGPLEITTPDVTLTAKGIGVGVVVTAYHDTVLDIRANDVTVHGFRFIGANVSVSHARGVVLDYSLFYLGEGVTADQAELTITRSGIRSGAEAPNGSGIHVEGPVGDGFTLRKSSVRQSYHGITLVDVQNARIEDAAVSAKGGNAVHLVAESRNVVGTRIRNTELAGNGGTILRIDQADGQVRDTVLRQNDIHHFHRGVVVQDDGQIAWTDEPVDARANHWNQPHPTARHRGPVQVAPWCVDESCVAAKKLV